LQFTLNASIFIKVRVMRPLDSATTFDFTPYTVSIYDSVLVRLKAADLDQEVKERAISCMGFIVSHLGDHLAGKKLKMINSAYF
jgi:cullin-associated NEDD8-dissociated protein 1